MSTDTDIKNLKGEIEKLKKAIQKNLEDGNYQIDNLSGLLQKRENELRQIEAKRKLTEANIENEADRKTIGTGQGGFVIRPQQDAPAKYTLKTRKSTAELDADKKKRAEDQEDQRKKKQKEEEEEEKKKEKRK